MHIRTGSVVVGPAAAQAAASTSTLSGYNTRQPLQRRRCCVAMHGATSPSLLPALDDPLSDALPLRHKRVLLTAPRQYAGRLASLLIAAGASPIWLPGVEITKLPDSECTELDAALVSLGDYQYLAFTSKNGIHAVMGRLERLKGGPAAAAAHIRASGVQTCALGADREALSEGWGLEVHISPPEASTSGLVAELERRGLARGARVLAPVPLVTGGLQEPPVVPRFMAGLTRIGADAVRVPAYATTPGLPGPEGLAAAAEERRLVESGAVHAIVFSSTAEAQGLCRLMGGREALAAAVQRNGTILAAHGPYTAAGASDVIGLPVPVVSKSFSTFHGAVAALAAAFDPSTPSANPSDAPTHQ